MEPQRQLPPRQQQLLEATVRTLEAEPVVAGAWLGGSYGQGVGDDYSDVDVHCYVADDDLVAIETNGRELIDAITPSVMCRQLGSAELGSVGWAVITPRWDHLDLWFTTRSNVERRGGAGPGTRVLLDREGLLHVGGVAPPLEPVEPTFPRELVENFLYAIGNLPVVAARGELVLLMMSVPLLLHRMVLPLLHAERGVVPKGGFLRLSQHLDEEQYADLLTMPPLRFDVDVLVDANIWLAELFLRRARALAQRTGADYPEDFERATIERIRDALGRTIAP